jgi:hypothetical protein
MYFLFISWQDPYFYTTTLTFFVYFILLLPKANMTVDAKWVCHIHSNNLKCTLHTHKQEKKVFNHKCNN